MGRSKYDILKTQTNNTMLIWKESRGISPNSVADKMESAMLRWMSELTDALDIWIEKGISMTEGELILARTNMGALVESWLKFFYCAFFEDYLKNPKFDNKGKIIEPNKMKFESLKEFSTGILWETEQDSLYVWVDKMQHYRNAIHAFNYRDIGSAQEFVADIDTFYQFVEAILDRLPPVEDFIECYPEGYIMNPYF